MPTVKTALRDDKARFVVTRAVRSAAMHMIVDPTTRLRTSTEYRSGIVIGQGTFSLIFCEDM